MIGWLALGTAGSLGVLLFAERRDRRWAPAAKAATSTGFIAVAVAAGAIGSGYGRVVLVALGLSWLGDLLLTGSGRNRFLGDLVAFLVAHLAYTVAFAIWGITVVISGAAAFGVTVIAAVVWRWLRPHLDASMRLPVATYVVVISAMVVLALGTAESRIAVGAVLFFVSDLAVARGRFVVSVFSNRAWGLPLYYGAQTLLAWSPAMV